MNEMLSRELLERLTGFATVSRDSNLEMIDFIRHYLVDLAVAAIPNRPAGPLVIGISRTNWVVRASSHAMFPMRRSRSSSSGGGCNPSQ